MAKAYRVRETTTTEGTGAYSLSGTITGFQTALSGIGPGVVETFMATDGINWEIFKGRVTAGTPDTLSREEILGSSNGGAAVNWSAGAKNIYHIFSLEDVADYTPSLATDLSYGGRTFVDVVGEAVAFGDVLYRDKTLGQWFKASGSDALMMPGLVLAVGSAATGESCRMLRSGFVRNDAWNWTTDNSVHMLYVDRTTAGLITETFNATDHRFKQIIGTIYASNIIDFRPAIVQGYGIGQEDIRYNEIMAALNENDIYPGEIVFHTSGATFEPVIVLYDGSTATIEWTFSDGSTSDSLTPSADFGTAGTRVQRLRVTPWEDLYRINVGYNRDDGGASTDTQGNSFEVVAAQPVTNIANLKLVQNSLMYLCGSRTPMTSVDVRDFTALHTLEFYGCEATLASADIYGTSNLRRCCFEGSYVGFLDFSQSPLIEDVRGSTCHLTEIRWGTTGQHLWHMCVRDNSAYLDPTTWPDMTQFPVLRDCWISGNGLTNPLELNSTVITSVWCQNNNHPTMDFTGAFPSGDHYINAYNNPACTEIIIDGCPGLTDLDANGCALTQTNVDYILATLDTNGATGGTLNLSGGTNAAPSATGIAAQTSLEGKGWTVTINEPAVPVLTAAEIGADGTTWSFTFNEAVQFGAGGNGGFAVTMTNAGVVTLTYASGSGSSALVYTGDVTVQAGDTVSSGLDYTQPGDGIENTAGNDLVSFAGESVTNSSAAGPPALVSATLGADGMTWSLAFNEAVEFGAGGNGGFAVEFASAGTVVLTYSSGSGSNTLVYTGDQAVQGDDTVVSGLDYTQPGDGIENTAGYDVVSFTGHAVVNNSLIGPPAMVSATLGTDGMTWNMVFSKAVTIGAGGSGGFGIEFTTAGVVALTYGSGDGTTSLVYTGDTIVAAGDPVVSGLDYTQPGDGIEDDLGFDLASFTGHAITNNSQVGGVLITLGDSAEGNGLNSSTYSITTDQAVSWDAGDVVLVHAGWWYGDTAVTVSDDSGQGNTYTAIAETLVTETIHHQFFYCVMGSAGSGSITLATGGDSSFVSIRAMVFSNVDTNDPIDAAAFDNDGSITFSTVSENTCVVLGIHDDSGYTGRTVTPSTMTILFDQDGGAYRPIAYEVYSEVQSNVEFTMQAGTLSNANIVALKGL